jgi:hypothetical protein
MEFVNTVRRFSSWEDYEKSYFILMEFLGIDFKDVMDMPISMHNKCLEFRDEILRKEQEQMSRISSSRRFKL